MENISSEFETRSELHFEVHLNGVPLGEGLAPRDAGALYRDFLRREVQR